MFYVAHMSEAALQALGRAVPQFDIHDRMRKARETAGLDQAQLARRCGIGRTTLISLESGRKRPTRPQLLAWSMATGVAYEWMCHGDAEPCVASLRRSEGDGFSPDGSKIFMQRFSLSAVN